MTGRAFVLSVALAAAPLPALAHAFLERAVPTAGESLRTGPAKIELNFSETLEGAFSAIAVTDAGGHDVSAGPSVVNGTALILPLKPLKPGRYRVSWHAVSVDAHRTEGKYNFVVAP